MEFLRFGSSIPGSYWGCCAFDIIQNFGAYDPDDPLSIEMVDGEDLTDGREEMLGVKIKVIPVVFRNRKC